jgi:hypothetical protein
VISHTRHTTKACKVCAFWPRKLAAQLDVRNLVQTKESAEGAILYILLYSISYFNLGVLWYLEILHFVVATINLHQEILILQ